MWTVTLSALTQDPLGVVQITADRRSNVGAVSRRVTRAKTLDGGYALHDGGQAAADRDIRLEWPTNQAVDDAVERLVRLYGQAVLSQRDGCFKVALEAFKRGTPRSTLTLLVLERLSE
jgi:hypothetical protein